MTSFVSIDLHIRFTGHLQFRLIPMKIYGLPVTCLSCNLQEESICFSGQGSVNNGNLIFSVDGKWYFKFKLELMHAMQALHLFSMSFFIPDHQNLLPSASIFVEPGCPKCNASTTCLLGSSETTILSPANSKPNRLLILLKMGENSTRGLFFCLF